MRGKYQKDFQKKHGIKLGLMSPFVRATAYALNEIPIVNAVIDESEIVYRHFVDISVAVATPKGLVVPVLRNVESMNYAQIEQEMATIGEKISLYAILGPESCKPENFSSFRPKIACSESSSLAGI